MRSLRQELIFGALFLLSSVSTLRHIDAFALPLPQSNNLRQRKNANNDHKQITPDRLAGKFGERFRDNVRFSAVIDPFSTTETISFIGDTLQNMGREEAEQLAGPFFGASLFPYLAFLWLLAREENQCPKGVTVGFATCLLFVFLTIPAAIASQVLYGVSLADSDWLHGSAESLLTVTNLVTVVAFRQALESKENGSPLPISATSWAPMTWLVVGLTTLATITAVIPAISDPLVHTQYLGGFMDLPFRFDSLGANAEPENALTIPTWIIHPSSTNHHSPRS